MNLAFYTCFYGTSQNQAFKIPDIPSIKYNCYYITNNMDMIEKLRSTKWIPIHDNVAVSNNLDESCMMAKYPKCNPQNFKELQSYIYLCFLDSKLNKLNEMLIERLIIENFINNNYAILVRKHWFVGNYIWDEFRESMKHERYKKDSIKYIQYIDSQLKLGLNDYNESHCACGLIIRNMKHEYINDINNSWYNHIKLCGIQDQISFFFIKQMYNKYIKAFTEIPFIN